MKGVLWAEDREIRAIHTGGGLVEVRKGDIAMVVVVRRWEDAIAEIAKLAAMYSLTAKPEDA
jgi:hypothetical protein